MLVVVCDLPLQLRTLETWGTYRDARTGHAIPFTRDLDRLAALLAEDVSRAGRTADPVRDQARRASSFLVGGAGDPRASGMTKENVAPAPTALSTETWPPWASTIVFTMWSPSPIPLWPPFACQ